MPDAPKGSLNVIRPRFVTKEETRKTRHEMARERDQKEHIFERFDGSKNIIEDAWAEAKHARKDTFSLHITFDLTSGGLLSRDRVADIIRQWVVETYNYELGLDSYDDKKNEVRFSIDPGA